MRRAIRAQIEQPTEFASPRRNVLRARNAKFTPEIGQKICEMIMAKHSLTDIVQMPGMPAMTTVCRWLADPRMAEFREMYYYARRVQAELYVDEIMSIADDTSEDWVPSYDKKGNQNGWKPDNEAIQRSRVRIDTRKWYAAKMVPRLYGEHVDVTHDVTGDLAELLKSASNQNSGIPEPIDVKPSR